MRIKSWYQSLLMFAFLTWIPASFAVSSTQSEDHPVSSGDLKPDKVTPVQIQNIILLAQGFINKPSIANSEHQYFNLDKACPTDYKPYVEMYVSQISSSNHQLNQGFGICVQGINFGRNSYSVNYLISKQYTFAHYQDTHSWVGKDSALFRTKPLPGMMVIDGTQINPNNFNGIYWNLYCYPKGMPLPIDQTDPANTAARGCVIGKPPF